MIKKYKNKIILALIGLAIMSVYIFFTTWQERTYKEVHTMYPIEKSKNPEASEEFLKAMEYRIYIKELHPYFDYDSFVMAPLLMKMNYHFKKGVKLLPKDSVEDIVWWTLFYKEIYGLLVPPRNDNSMAYENLPPKEFAKVHDAIYRMIMRYPEGKVYFDIPEIRQFRFKVMAILVGFYIDRCTRRYEGKDQRSRAIQAANDIELYKHLNKILNKYKLAYHKFSQDVRNREFMQNEYFSDIIYIYTETIMNYTFIHKTQKLPANICNSDDSKLIIQYSNKLIGYIEDEKDMQSKRIYESLFKENHTSFVPDIFKLLNYRCPNLQPDISQLVYKIDKLNQKFNERDN